MSGLDTLGILLGGLKGYVGKGKWVMTQERSFTPQEMEQITKVTPVQGKYGLSICFAMKDGSFRYITADSNPGEGYAAYEIGEKDIDLSKMVIRALKNQAKEEHPELYPQDKDFCLRVARKLDPETPTEATSFDNPFGLKL